MEYSIVYKGVKITVTDENTKFGWTAFFSNAPESSRKVGNVKPLEGAKSKERAFKAAKNFIDRHQKVAREYIDIFTIYVSLQLDNTWNYRIVSGCTEEKTGFKTSGKALKSARDRVKERINEWEEKQLKRQIQLES